MRTSTRGPRFAALISSAVLLTFAWALHTSSAFAVDAVQFPCNGVSGTTCDVFQLDGSAAATANADTCVKGEFACPGAEENPVWPADWDSLLFPTLAGGSNPPLSGSPPGAWTFALPWNGFGSFSGVFKSTLVSQGQSTILKQGSKNGADISTWVVASQSSPPKDAYLAAALATYTGPPGPYAGHELVYFSSTRFAPNGSATIGIWFFKQNVQVCASGPNAGKAMCVGNTTTLAQHKVGDLFLFITFGGSGIATIQASTWQGADGTGGFLGTAPGSISLCPTANDDACAVANANGAFTTTLGASTSTFQAPGVGFNVSGPGFAGFAGGVIPTLQLEEGGVDLNGIFEGNAPCFSSVMFASVTSGSSPATAALKSILLGSFNTCAISATKSCGNASPNQNNGTVTYTISGSVENTGGGAVTGLSITDSFNGSSQAISGLACTCGPTGCAITGTDCSTVTLQPGGTANYTATITTTANGGSDVVTATMNGVGGGSASGTSNTASCPSVSLSDSIGITKACNTSLVSTSCGLTVQVGAGGNVTNTSQGLSLSNITVYDCRGGTFTTAGNPSSCTTGSPTVIPIGTLAAGAQAPYTDTFNPTVLPSDATSNSCPNGTFSDTVLVVGQCTSAFCQTGTVFNTATASCPLCPLH